MIRNTCFNNWTPSRPTRARKSLWVQWREGEKWESWQGARPGDWDRSQVGWGKGRPGGDCAPGQEVEQPGGSAPLSQRDRPRSQAPNTSIQALVLPSSRFDLLSSPEVCMCPSGSLAGAQLPSPRSVCRLLSQGSSSCFWAHWIPVQTWSGQNSGVPCFPQFELSFCFWKTLYPQPIFLSFCILISAPFIWYTLNLDVF